MMKNTTKRLGLLIFLVIAACQTIRYQDDTGFLNSAQASSFEYPLKVAGKICKDMDGKVGACIKHVRSDRPVQFRIDPQSYSYRLRVVCTSDMDSNFSADVEKGKSFSWEVEPDSFKFLRSFTCIGEIFPVDRDNNKISAKWQLRALVYDGSYKGRESIYYKEGHLVLGKFARHSRVCDKGECKRYSKKPIIKASKDAKAYSESLLMRMNSYNL